MAVWTGKEGKRISEARNGENIRSSQLLTRKSQEKVEGKSWKVIIKEVERCVHESVIARRGNCDWKSWNPRIIIDDSFRRSERKETRLCCLSMTNGCRFFFPPHSDIWRRWQKNEFEVGKRNGQRIEERSRKMLFEWYTWEGVLVETMDSRRRKGRMELSVRKRWQINEKNSIESQRENISFLFFNQEDEGRQWREKLGQIERVDPSRSRNCWRNPLPSVFYQ